MNKIALVYARSVFSRKSPVTQQTLSFVVRVDNIAYDKRVDIEWAGEDGVWHSQSATHHSTIDRHQEYWVARLAFPLTADRSLPGNVRFALRYRVAGAEYWDNDQGRNYSIEADSGILTGDDMAVVNTQFEGTLAEHAKHLPIAVAVDRRLAAERVTIHWSGDNWATSHQAPCRFTPNYWDTESLSNARNPNQYGRQVWNSTLPIDEIFQIQYKISCKTQHGLVWDDNFGQNYTAQRAPLKVLILNLHCYQEADQDFKLSQIAKAIDEVNADIVCLQEVAELWNDGQGDWQTNSARIINERLKAPYFLVTDWSHRGFDRYREGVAILSRHPIERNGARYVSTSRAPTSIHSRKVVMAQIRVPYSGLINVFSSHLSWWDDGFAEQFDALRQWSADEHTGQTAATMLCGDFNIKAGSRGYRHVVESKEYDDQYLSANSPHVFRKVFEAGEPVWQHYLEEDHRIDYVFLRKGSRLAVTSGRTVFTDRDYGRVSDHFGYLLTFVPR